MKKHIFDEKNGLHYTRRGNVYLPDLAYSKNDYPPLGKYGILRKTYLQQHLAEQCLAETYNQTVVVKVQIPYISTELSWWFLD